VSNVVHLGGGVLTKQQLATHLGRSPRWVEIRVKQGMPSLDPTARYAQRRFRLADVEAWLNDGPKAASTVDRLAMLEARVATLERMIGNQNRSAG